ncbi:MAG TPA: hypothetical protein VMP01_19320 [Pirellulaceae bacterium]|nr:hypothetical protein [Pirellulaceae bacterium]
MAIEFACTSCQKLLRVPDDAPGKQVKCPNCGMIQAVPAGITSGPPAESSQPWSFSEPGAGSAPPTQYSHGSGGALNPYAPPSPVTFAPKPSNDVPITNQRPTIEDILGHAWRVWQENLGLLVGVTLVIVGISWAIGIPLGFMQAALEANGEKEMAAIVGGVGNIIAQVVQIFLGIGQSQIALKLARGQPAEFGDLFHGGSRFWPVLGVSILLGLAVFAGMLACIVPGIILALMLWPTYYLVVENRSKVFDSFSLAYQITEGNKGTTFVLALIGMGINLLGVLALCIGLLFSAPLVVMIFVTAYLMMSGQLFPGGVKQPGAYPA